MKAEWSQQARDDLIHIFLHVAKDDPAAARRLLNKLRKSEDMVRTHPMLGRVVPEFDVANIREHIIPPYRVIYQISATGVLFLTVIHGRQDLSVLGPAAYVVPDDEE